MLYKKKGEPTLTKELFQSPTSEFRGAPFWAWNCKLDVDELKRQVEVLKEMGFGGGHMHVRTGMATPYLSPEYMDIIKSVVEKFKAEDMHAYLYDEDRWPSGAAGGLVTKEKKFRGRYLLFTPTPYGEGEKDQFSGSRAAGGRTEEGTLLACFDVELDKDGYLLSYKNIGPEEKAEHRKWYAYMELLSESGWYNNQTYVNTLDKAAMDRFIEITYEAYNRTIAGEFDETVPSIFTDEPQFTRKGTLKYARDLKDVVLPWTDDLPETFKKAYGEDLMAGIPELFWDKKSDEPSLIRYHYHDHICERFTEAFADNCGKWCREHNLKLTGHMMEEPTLESQTAALGEAMRAYRGFDIPGIDMLCARFEYTTAKQVQSAVHQYGYEGMTSELYGVTNWDFDFRGHKLHGDWQAALGVTLRVPHLAWVSMKGEAKRDYPASINYQSPWWKEYHRVEDHFARVNTALTRGKPVVRVGVIHPIESYWLHWGPSEATSLLREELDENFQKITEWLLFGSVDFDFICESTLPAQCAAGSNPLQVGEMKYDVVLVPGVETLRSTTVERLEAFKKAGGKLIFAGQLPKFVDAKKDSRAVSVTEGADCIPFSRGSVLSALDSYREVEIRTEAGSLSNNLIYQYRKDYDCSWLFVAHAKEPVKQDLANKNTLRIKVRGQFDAELYNTLTGEIRKADYVISNGFTTLYTDCYDYDSFLFKLTETAEKEAQNVQDLSLLGTEPVKNPCLFNMDQDQSVVHSGYFDYTLSEPNAVLVDMAEWKLDEGAWQPVEEILRIENIIRDLLGYQSKREAFPQPWVVSDESEPHKVTMKMKIRSAVSVKGAKLAIEDADKIELTWNGKPVDKKIEGFYVDRSIELIDLPEICQGENEMIVTIPFGKRSNLEWCYIIGQFGVQVNGQQVLITEMPEKLTFGDITRQGFPFYGGNIQIQVPVETSGKDLYVRSSMFRASLQTVSLDGGRDEGIYYPPYTVCFKNVPAGSHKLTFTMFGHRRNSFGPVHLADLVQRWIGPQAWRTVGAEFSYDYQIHEEGILTTPTVFEAE